MAWTVTNDDSMREAAAAGSDPEHGPILFAVAASDIVRRSRRDEGMGPSRPGWVGTRGVVSRPCIGNRGLSAAGRG